MSNYAKIHKAVPRKRIFQAEPRTRIFEAVPRKRIFPVRYEGWGDNAIVIPPTWGPDLISNGDFVDGLYWTLSSAMVIAGGVLHYDDLANGTAENSTTDLVIGKTYRIKFDILNTVAPGAYIRFWDGGWLELTPAYTYYLNGSTEIEIVAPRTKTGFKIKSLTAGQPYDIDNIVIQEKL